MRLCRSILADSRPRRPMRERVMTGPPDMPDRRENAAATPQTGPRYHVPQPFQPGPYPPGYPPPPSYYYGGPPTAGRAEEWAGYRLAGAGRRRASQCCDGFAPIASGSCRGRLRFLRAWTREAWHRQQRRCRDRRHRVGRLGSCCRVGVHRDLDDGLEGRRAAEITSTARRKPAPTTSCSSSAPTSFGKASKTGSALR